MIPGGLGLTELTVDGLLTPRLGLACATAATLVMRFATLWFAVVIGVAVLAFERRGTARMRRAGSSAPADSQEVCAPSAETRG